MFFDLVLPALVNESRGVAVSIQARMNRSWELFDVSHSSGRLVAVRSPRQAPFCLLSCLARGRLLGQSASYFRLELAFLSTPPTVAI